MRVSLFAAQMKFKTDIGENLIDISFPAVACEQAPKREHAKILASEAGEPVRRLFLP